MPKLVKFLFPFWVLNWLEACTFTFFFTSAIYEIDLPSLAELDFLALWLLFEANPFSHIANALKLEEKNQQFAKIQAEKSKSLSFSIFNLITQHFRLLRYKCICV